MPLIEQFVVLKSKPVSVVKLGEILQDVTVPDIEGVMVEIKAPWVNVKGDPI